MSTLKKIEWKFGVTASNEELKDVGSTFLQLKLDTITGKYVEHSSAAEHSDVLWLRLLLQKPPFIYFCGAACRRPTSLSSLCRNSTSSSTSWRRCSSAVDMGVNKINFLVLRLPQVPRLSLQRAGLGVRPVT